MAKPTTDMKSINTLFLFLSAIVPCGGSTPDL